MNQIKVLARENNEMPVSFLGHAAGIRCGLGDGARLRFCVCARYPSYQTTATSPRPSVGGTRRRIRARRRAAQALPHWLVVRVVQLDESNDQPDDSGIELDVDDLAGHFTDWRTMDLHAGELPDQSPWLAATTAVMRRGVIDDLLAADNTNKKRQAKARAKGRRMHRSRLVFDDHP